MRAVAGAFRDDRAAAGLTLVFALAGLAITGMLLLPTLVSKTSQRNNAREELILARLEDGFRDYVRLNQIIPGTGTWVTAIGSIGGLNVTQVNCVFPEHPDDTTTRRVFVVDDILGGASPVLPYTQTAAGLTGSLTNLLNSRARAMIVSSTKRGLALPISSGFLTQANFDAIWNWNHNPATESPPSGWPSAWTGNGEFLHVKPIYLPNFFSKITLENVKFDLGFLSLPSITPSSATDYYLLDGAPLTLATTLGVIKRRHLVRGDASFNFGSSSLPPLIWYQMEERSGTYATNSGSLGTTAAGTISSGINYGQNGPQPPTYLNFDEKNYCMDFNARTECINTSISPLSNLRAFTLACWVNVSRVSSSRTGLIGQNDAIELGFISSSDVQLWTPSGGDLTVRWPYPGSTWHHIAATGDGSQIKLYFDGVLVGTTTRGTSNYGSSTDRFYVGGAGVFDTPFSSSVYKGKIDEVIVYDRGLNAAEVLSLSIGIIP